MAFNEELAFRIRQHVQNEPHMKEKRMFGGVAFMYKNKMSVGVIKNDLMVRVIADKMEGELAKENISPMQFTGKPMKEFITVGQEACNKENELAYFITLGIEHAESKQA